jgi:hypothetical protein
MMLDAARLPAAGRIAQFTPWDPMTQLLPPFLGLTLIAIGAGYAVFEATGRPEWRVSPDRHFGMALGAGLLLAAPLWPLAMAQSSVGPSEALLQAGNVLRLPGAVLLVASSVIWVANVWPTRRHPERAAEVRAWWPVGSDSALSVATVVGTAATLLVVALFVTFFLPLVDRSYLAPTPRTAARVLVPGRLPAAGRATYAADGCVHCHTQRVRALPEDEAYGPPTRGGDFDQAPALEGARRAGPDLAWVGARHADRAAMTESLSVHGPSGVAAFPWLVDDQGTTARGAALVDYLLRLRAPSEGVP